MSLVFGISAAKVFVSFVVEVAPDVGLSAD